ncbi:LamB/YcsF family protein [Pseudomonas sp. R5(2019)]|uniref:LamB/YcsF family protein n=1 Tax=Pseudomonas sp. R5(2019) TaxID=2697566 RepID=UPI001412067E|nr:5-oxoprolinase subunit PxpA [Pseudomonas sp. R5(2019)]NBA94869.1 5-oxoprolinase subunit PxpA [Pseudomonas sp. R5(2019)]
MSTTALTVDLNSDMGEGFGAYAMGHDAAILDLVSSANVACGFHAGDPQIMAATFAMAKDKGVAVGAHPGFPDLWGFGRRNMAFSLAEIERLVAYQIGAAQALSAYAGHPITHVKAHGALGNLTQTDAGVAQAVCRAIKAVDPTLVCLVIALGHQARIAAEMGLSARSEIFADRAYTEEGHLVSRTLPGAVIHDPELAAARVVRMVRAQGIETLSGRLLDCPVDSICVHSDTPAAVQIAACVRRTLEQQDIAITGFA